jgi:hypothetical protein
MSGFTKFASFLLAASLCASFPAWAQRGGVRKPLKKKQVQKTDPVSPALPAYTPSPLQPLPLDQVPVVAPRVQYSGGELTIVAHNSTLSDVLKEVKQKTGADLEIPPNASERVVADLGPGPARDVLAQLLNGTHFNYVMVGSATDPTAVQSIVLTPKSGAADSSATTAAANHPGVPQHFPGASAAPPVVDTAADDTADEPEPPEEQVDQQNDQNQQNPNQPPPKTPEELLQELQRQQQQQQQNPQAGPQTILPNQPPTAAPPNPKRPE